MAAPVIQPIQSVLFYRVGEYREFQPYASNSPTSWACSPLPDGLSFDPVIGRIYGSAEAAGVFVFGLRAANDDGMSETAIFTMGVAPVAGSLREAAVTLYIDVDTRSVGLSPGGEPELEDPIFWAKYGDSQIFAVQFVRSGSVIELPVEGMVMALKEYDGEGIIGLSDGFAQEGELGSARYVVHMDFGQEGIRGALANYQGDFRTAFPALFEIEWRETNTTGVGPGVLTYSSRTQRFELSSELKPTEDTP